MFPALSLPLCSVEYSNSGTVFTRLWATPGLGGRGRSALGPTQTPSQWVPGNLSAELTSRDSKLISRH